LVKAKTDFFQGPLNPLLRSSGIWASTEFVNRKRSGVARFITLIIREEGGRSTKPKAYERGSPIVSGKRSDQREAKFSTKGRKKKTCSEPEPSLLVNGVNAAVDAGTKAKTAGRGASNWENQNR